MDSYSKRLAWAIRNAGLTQTNLAKVAGVSPQTVQYLCDPKRGAQGSKHNSRFAEALGVSSIWLETGEGQITPDDGSTRTHKFHVHSGLGHPEIKSVLVHMFNATGSMGCGICQPEDDTVTSSVWLSEQWIRTNLERSITGIHNLAIITGHGDSMSPTFNDGDVLLIDTEVKCITIDGVYVLSANNRLYIKRVRQRLDGQFEISSDNQTVKTVDILNGDHEITIHGRVVWAWNGRKL